MAPAHTDKQYEQELKDLRDMLLGMGGKVEAAIAASVRAITERDAELAQRVRASDVASSPPPSRSSPTSSGWATSR